MRKCTKTYIVVEWVIIRSLFPLQVSYFNYVLELTNNL